MAPPTRHSSRLTSTGHGLRKKEDENAGVNPLNRPTTRTLRGRKEPLIGKPDPNKAALLEGKPAPTAVNVRKRILDDRTNSMKTFQPDSIVPLKPMLPKKELPTRKTSAATAAKRTVTVLQDVNMPIVPKAPVRRVPTTRPTVKKPVPSNTQATVRPGQSSNLHGHSRLNSTSSNATAPVSHKPSTRPNALSSRHNSIHDNLHATKKLRTSEPEELEKENTRAPKLSLAASDLERKKQISLKSIGANLAPELKPPSPVAELKPGEAGWEDLDDGDEEDPLMVKEYVNEIYSYIKELELETLPDPDYMSRQHELTWKMRGVLVDWMIEVHSKFRLLPETLFLAINLMDRFLSKRTVALIKFQLVGVTSLFLASKYEEVICPSVTNFLYMTDGGYDCEEILKAETYMLEMLDWDLRYPNPLNFLRRISKADQYDIQSRTFAKYFMEISIVDYRLVATPPSLLAATSIWLARKLLVRGYWNANLIHYSGYTEAEILPSAQIMLDYVLRSTCKDLGLGLEPTFVCSSAYQGGHEHGNLFKKYATRKFFRVSELVSGWAVGRYAIETPTGWEWTRLEEWTHPSADNPELHSDEHDEMEF